MALLRQPPRLRRSRLLGTPAHRRRSQSPVSFTRSQFIESRHLNFILWLIVGGLIGWVASMVMGTNGRQGKFLNVAVGIVGAILGGWLLSGPFGSSTINQGGFSLTGLAVSLLGAIILLAMARLARGAASQ